MLRFRLLGVPYEIEVSFWIGSAILGSNVARGEHGPLRLATWVLCVFGSVVLHELGHALAARRYGAAPRVALYQLGGLTFFPGAAFTRPQYLAVVLAGPLAGFAGYCVVGVAAPYLLAALAAGGWLDPYPLVDETLRDAVKFLLYANGYWTLFNLLPIRPLDGGQALGTILGPGLTGLTRGIGVACAGALGAWALTEGRYFLAFFLGYLAYSNLRGGTRTLPGAPAGRG